MKSNASAWGMGSSSGYGLCARSQGDTCRARGAGRLFRETLLVTVSEEPRLEGSS